MVSRIAQWTLDVHDVDAMAAFWSPALGYRVDRNRDGIVHLPPEGAAPDVPTVWLQPTVEPKTRYGAAGTVVDRWTIGPQDQWFDRLEQKRRELGWPLPEENADGS